MSKRYDEEFKKELVNEYLKGISLNEIFITYWAPKSIVNGWVKNIAKNATTQNHNTKKQNNYVYVLYNHIRPHSHNGGLTPFEARNKS